ncbi:MAG: ATP-binding protein [bacterium]|nr:ATP-binding protein [bacterium]
MFEGGRAGSREDLSEEVLLFSEHRGLYDQIRFLDETGMEVVRANFNDGNPGVVPDEQLQSKANRYYFKVTFQLGRGEVYVSPFDLNVERGKIEQPLKPIIRFATPVFDSRARKRGVIIVNYLGAGLLSKLEREAARSPGQFMLLNSEGFYLKGPQPEDEWGFVFKDRSDRTFGNAFPEAWQRISRAESGRYYSANGLFTFASVYPLLEAQESSAELVKAFTPSFDRLKAEEYYWKIVSRVPPGVLNARSGELLGKLLGLYAFIVVLLAIGSRYLARAGVRRRLAEEELREHHDQLEGLVGERTAELAEAVEGLEGEIAERKRAEEGLERSAHQRSVVAELGSLALEGGELQGLMDEAVRLAAEALDVKLFKILELEESGESFRLVSGVGWREGLVGKASVGAELESPDGYTLREGVPVIIEELQSQRRFIVPRFLLDHGVVSGLSVPMVAADFFVFGVMGVHTTQRRDFSEDDVRFLESVANVVTTAVLRKRVEEALREAHLELQQAYDTLEQTQAAAIVAEKMAAVGRLTAGVSHEVLNPLTTINLVLQRLLDDPDIDPLLAEDLRGIEEQADRIVKVSQGLLSFSRQGKPERCPIELNEVVTKTLTLLEYDLKLQNIDVEMNLAEDLPLILADEDQLQQVILNLLTNARDVMPKGGRLVLSTAEVEPLFADRERAVELRVEDTGPGIPPEHMDKLFEPFFTTKPEGGGTGLGLSICQGIIESHGGVIRAENVPGGGAAFIVHLNMEGEHAEQDLGG